MHKNDFRVKYFLSCDSTVFIIALLVCSVNHLSRLVPASGLIRSALELSAGEKNASPRVKKRRSRPSTAEEKEDDLLPELTPVPGTELRLTPLPCESYPKGSTPAEITKHSLDQSYTLESMLSTYEK